MEKEKDFRKRTKYDDNEKWMKRAHKQVMETMIKVLHSAIHKDDYSPLLVAGYIRSTRALRLKRANGSKGYVPTDIIALCSLFYDSYPLLSTAIQIKGIISPIYLNINAIQT